MALEFADVLIRKGKSRAYQRSRKPLANGTAQAEKLLKEGFVARRTRQGESLSTSRKRTSESRTGSLVMEENNSVLSLDRGTARHAQCWQCKPCTSPHQAEAKNAARRALKFLAEKSDALTPSFQFPHSSPTVRHDRYISDGEIL